ncbi:multicopper oxidase domain-containing protein [Nocardioides sp.]|uniref:multicopper oxidase domain-containing protein n=1 Tax=Nocardioides sp. TaxID=35761 RepID=UPI00286DCE25|nr:multicopper oxidase domain-containing protein [Nocardioides sp.]
MRKALLGGVLLVLLLSGRVVATSAPAQQQAPALAAGTTGQQRTYYIAAEEVLWDYAPHDRNDIAGRAWNPDEQVFVENGPTRIGHVYRKSLYRGYTDASFSKRVAVPTTCPAGVKPCDDTLGMMGPVIRAVVGDTVKVVFKNNTSYPASIHPHGVLYDKAGEGAPYDDGTSGANKADDAVAPGATYVYNWTVPERSGPGPMDGSSVMWMYHSHTDEIADTNAGLIGPMVITARARADVASATPADVDREIFSFYTVDNENASMHLDRNLAELALSPNQVATSDQEAFEESNLMHSINGYVYGNGPVPTMKVGQRVRWYTFSLGTEVDLHTPHWHGNTETSNGMRSDMIQLLPGMMMVSDMVPDAPGTWLFHCHVNDHIAAGMLARYRVVS